MVYETEDLSPQKTGKTETFEGQNVWIEETELWE